MKVNLTESFANMRGGCAFNFDGTERKPGHYTDIEANIARWKQKYGTPVPDNVLKHWLL